MILPDYFNIALFIISTLLLLIMLYSSIKENEKRAAVFSVLFLFINSAVWSALLLSSNYAPVRFINYLLLLFILSFLLISSVKWFPRGEIIDKERIVQFDERDHMFARNNLQYSRTNFDKYYSSHPDKKDIDIRIHSLPEIAQEGGKFYQSYYGLFLDAVDTFTRWSYNLHEVKKAKSKLEINPSEMTLLIKKMGKQLGAADVGIARLEKYHFYSHAGRQTDTWGERISSRHKYAIVVILPMNINMIKESPALPVVIESTTRYLEAAKIAHVIANYIKFLGYEARTHFDARYQLLCVPTARDAGLGEIGRMGILIHPVLGPCLRISVVTTDMELEETAERGYQGISSFCKICRKCADNCPTSSIEHAGMKESRGFKHWSINQEECFSFWKKIGTDCAFCIRVCPYTKPDTFIHRLVRLYISRNPFNQRIALFLDDLFYGRKMRPATSNPCNASMIQ